MNKLSRKELIEDYLVDSELFPSDYSCSICMGPPVNPMKCLTCKCQGCSDCVKSWKNTKNKCPFRCTNTQWRVTPIPSIKLDFKCFHCKKFINCTIEELTKHIETCNKNPEGMRQRKLRREYLCKNNHPLSFHKASYYSMVNGRCAECEESLTRSFCHACNQGYCVKCRPLTCSKTRCQFGHALVDIVNTEKTNATCDFCGNVGGHEENFHLDRDCNLCVCSICFQTLPEKLNSYKSLSSTHCQRSHPLQIRSTKDLSSIKEPCSLCNKPSYCFWKCTKCTEIYCKECKPFEIKNFKFIESHICYRLYQKKNIDNHQCFECQKVRDTIYRDRKYGISFCKECLYSLQIQNERKDSMPNKDLGRCGEGHRLSYFKNYDDVRRECGGCKKQRNVRLFCIYCEPIKYSCLGCSPVSAKTGCVCNHALYPIQNPTQCLFCLKVRNCLHCQQCNFAVCEGCCDKDDIEELIMKSADKFTG